jgi:hypothetical protein
MNCFWIEIAAHADHDQNATVRAQLNRKNSLAATHKVEARRVRAGLARRWLNERTIENTIGKQQLFGCARI